jgi:hypothetical protein
MQVLKVCVVAKVAEGSGDFGYNKTTSMLDMLAAVLIQKK